MDLNAVFFTALFLHFLIYAVIAQGGYNDVECILLPTQNDISLEFRFKASEKGVRLVYLNLKIDKDSYHSLELQDEFLPDRWVWANNITEPMLSLPHDYDILSLGLLNYQVRSMDVHLKDQPSGCLANLNSTLQNMAVGRMLLENVTTESSSDQLSRKRDVVCVAVTTVTDDGYRGIVYRCCGIKTLGTDQPNGPSEIQCDLAVARSSEWMDMFNAFLVVVSFFMTFYLPALPLALPDYIFSLQYECDKEDRAEAEQKEQDERRNGHERIINASREEKTGASEIPVDDSSPVTCSALLRAYIQKLPDSRLSFNIKLAAMLFCIFPCVLYVQMVLWLTLKKRYIHESIKKQVQLPGESAPFLRVDSFLFLLLYVFPALVGLALVLFLRPKDLLFGYDRFLLSSPKPTTFLTFCFRNFTIIPPVPMLDFPSRHGPRKSPDFIGNEILFRLRRVQQLPAFVWNTLTQLHSSLLKKLLNFPTCSLSMFNRDVHVSRMRHGLHVLYFLFSTLLTLLVGLFGVMCVSFLLLVFVVSLSIALSPFATVSLPFLNALSSRNCCTVNLGTNGKILIKMIFFVIIICPFFLTPVLLLLYNSTSFVMYMLKFIMIGLYLNADNVTPYLTFLLVVTTNIYFCYGNLQNRYTEFKGLILNYRQKTLNISNGDLSTIPTSLFWFVTDRVLPVATETCRMFCKMALVVMFLSLSLNAVLFFKDTYSMSSEISTVSVFISGVIPGLFLKGITKGQVFSGWEKIRMKREIEIAVEEFDQERNGANRAIGGMGSSEISYSDQV